MAPQTDDNHCAAKPARYALEMNRGLVREARHRAGAKISGLPKPAQSPEVASRQKCRAKRSSLKFWPGLGLRIPPFEKCSMRSDISFASPGAEARAERRVVVELNVVENARPWSWKCGTMTLSADARFDEHVLQGTALNL